MREIVFAPGLDFDTLVHGILEGARTDEAVAASEQSGVNIGAGREEFGGSSGGDHAPSDGLIYLLTSLFSILMGTLAFGRTCTQS